MNARTTSQDDQSAIERAGREDRASQPPTAEFAKPAVPATAQTPASGAVPAGAALPAGVELPPPQPRPPGFRERARMRRRVRFLRKARELAYRDLGGLVFEMQRLNQRNDELVAAKLGVLAHFDTELRALERALDERQPVTVLRESGIGACPRCAAIHGSDDRFCPMCGMGMGRQAESPIAATPPTVTSAPAAPGSVVAQPGAVPLPLAAAEVAAASNLTPGQLALGAAPRAGAPAAPPAAPPATPPPTPPTTPPESPPLKTSPPVPARPLTGTPARARPPAPAQDEDRPTEIIRPRDESP
jgi:hypothetical protein